MFSLSKAQQYLIDHSIDAWLLADTHGINTALQEILGCKEELGRVFVHIPATGEPTLLISKLAVPEVKHWPYQTLTYASWPERNQYLKTLIQKAKTIAMEYSPEGALASVAIVDAGTIELIRSFGPTIVSSADLIQASCHSWSPANLASHQKAADALTEIKNSSLKKVAEAHFAGQNITEYDLQQFILKEFERLGLTADGDLPIVAANQHSSEPHYTPSAKQHALINPGDWLLLDIWARLNAPGSVYADITWVASARPVLPPKQQEIFNLVIAARDAVVSKIQEAWQRTQPVQGWELDRAARDLIESQGYGAQFIHTTGHSLGPETVHSPGVSLNDLSAHDTRLILPNTGFTIEPGVYLPEFGMRSEIDVFVDPEKGPVITTDIQQEITIIGQNLLR